MRPSRSKAILIAAVLLGSLTLPALRAEEQKPVFEEWSILVIDGKQCGYGSTITTKTDTPMGPQYHTVLVQELVVKRLEISMKVTETSKVTEDADGGVLSFEEQTSTFGSNIESSGVREGDDLVVSGRGQTKRYHVPRLTALGPEKIRELTKAVPLKPGQPFAFTMFESEYPQSVVTQKGVIEGQETRNVRGVDRKLWKMTSELSILPGVTSTTWVDDQGNDVEGLTPYAGLGELHQFAATRAECMKEPEGVEVFTTSVVRPQRAIPSPGDLAQAVYRLTQEGPDKKFLLWNKGEQRILSSTPGCCELSVSAPTISMSDVTWQLPHADTPELHPFLQTTSYLEVSSPEIQALAKEAVGGEKNPIKAAHRIEQFVSDYIIHKDMSVGFASAQETAKSREGDCTEHAVLCAALGRAAGLPTRCVVGFGYLPPGVGDPALTNEVDDETGMFVGHMWAEAWVGPDQWVPMDAALHGFDVGHIAVMKTALEEINPLVELLGPMNQVLQDLKVEVLKTTPKPGLNTGAAAKGTVP